MKRLIPFLFLVLLMFFACKRQPVKTEQSMASEPVIVVKMPKEYHDKLRVQLSEDKTHIVAFASQSDAAKQKPVPLTGGYFMTRMVGETFLSITIDDYSEAKRRFSPDELFNLIIREDVVLEKYDCSKCCSADSAEINKLIREDRLGECNKLSTSTSR